MARFAGDIFNNIRKFGIDPIEVTGDPIRDVGNAGRDMKRQNDMRDIEKKINFQGSGTQDEIDFQDAVTFAYEPADDSPNVFYEMENILGRNLEKGNIIPLGSNAGKQIADPFEVFVMPHLNLADSSHKKAISEAELEGIRDSSKEDQNILLNMIWNEKHARLLNENAAQSFENRMLFGLTNEAPSMNAREHMIQEDNRMRRIKQTRKALDNFDALNSGPEFNRTAPNVKNIDVAGIRKRSEAQQNLNKKRGEERKLRDANKEWDTRNLRLIDEEDDIPF